MASLRFRLPTIVVPCILFLSTGFALAQDHIRRPVRSPAQTPAQTGTISLTPAVVEAGSPELIRVSTAAISSTVASMDGELLGRKLQFFPGIDHKNWYALAGVDVEAPAGPTTLHITAHLTGITGAGNAGTENSGTENKTKSLSPTIEIHPAHYRTASITVPPKFVEPGPEEQKLIAAANKAKEEAFATSNPKPLWSGSFIAPVKAPPTDSFGTRRMFNGKLASIHKGTDFRAGTGTPVLAGNSGKVILAQPLYFEGNCVMIDHGLGLVSISMHLSRIDVKPGQSVEKGQRLGLSGATGRVTGPHLHWSIRWQGAMLDPARLLRLNLDTVR